MQYAVKSSEVSALVAPSSIAAPQVGMCASILGSVPDGKM